eukprot:986419-Pelagomonas_calceolata.AAC.1
MKSHDGMVMNEQMLLQNIRQINPTMAWQEEKREHAANVSTAPTPAHKLIYLLNLQNALKSHVHTNHRLGYVNPKTGYKGYKGKRPQSRRLTAS